MSGAKTKDFLVGFNTLGFRTVPDLARKGMYRAGAALLRDVVRDTPTPPLDEGTLRGSHSVFVDGKLAQVAPDPSGTGTPATQAPQGAAKPNQVIATIGANTPYAARLHEHPEYDFQEPGSGGKWLETKLQGNRKQYFKLMADFIKSGGKT